VTTVITDGKRLVMDYLRAHPVITPVTTRVRSTMPDDTRHPWIKGTLIDISDAAEPMEHLILYELQFDCYAGEDPDGKPGWPEANDLGLRVRAALKELKGSQGGAVASAVYLRGPKEIVDDDFTPDRARTIVEADVLIHA
jgi:hypothetical protein